MDKHDAERPSSGVYSAVKSPRRRSMRQHARTQTSLGNAVPGDGGQSDTGQALRGSRRNIILCEFHFPFHSSVTCHTYSKPLTFKTGAPRSCREPPIHNYPCDRCFPGGMKSSRADGAPPLQSVTTALEPRFLLRLEPDLTALRSCVWRAYGGLLAATPNPESPASGSVSSTFPALPQTPSLPPWQPPPPPARAGCTRLGIGASRLTGEAAAPAVWARQTPELQLQSSQKATGPHLPCVTHAAETRSQVGLLRTRSSPVSLLNTILRASHARGRAGAGSQQEEHGALCQGLGPPHHRLHASPPSQ